MATSPETPPAAADYAPLLNQTALRLTSDLKTAELSPDRLAVKYITGRRTVVMTPNQWSLLQRFMSGQTVTQVLCAAIAAQRCPSLRDFYELVVKASHAGILQAPAMALPPPVPPAKWPRLNGTFVRWLTLLFAIGAAAALFWRRVQLLPDPLWLVLGWLASLAALSLGWMLAAAVVRAAGCEVYRPRLAWKTLAPRFVADLDDVVMAGRAARINTALARLAPTFLFTGLAAWQMPELLVPLLATILLQLSPLWRSPLQDILAAFYRDPQLSTSYDLVLVRDRLFSMFGQARKHMADRKFLLACTLATVVWLGVVFLGGCVLLQTNASELWQKFNASGGARYTALGLLVTVGLAVATSLGLVLWSFIRHVRAWARENAERRLRPATVLVSPETIAEWLGKTVLFRDLGAEDLKAIAAAVKPELHKRGSFIVKEGDPGEKLYIVLSGRVEVRRDYAKGRSEPVAEMGDGAVFGEIALIRGGPRTRSVRALEKSVLLGLDKADFERLVLTKMTRAAVEDAVQKVGFLEQLELTRNWSHATLAAFARRAKLHEHPEGTTIIEEGNNNHWFYIVRRGEFAVIKNREEVRRLEVGDSFGEMSLLGDGIATATVKVVGKDASCLAISGADFLDFVTKDFVVGLGWDSTRKGPR